MSMVERGQYEKFDALDEDDIHPELRMKDLLEARGTKRSKSMPKETTKTPKGPHKEPRAQSISNVQRPDQVAEGARQVSGRRARSRSRTHRPHEGAPGASKAESSSHGSELEKHPPFAAAKARAPDQPRKPEPAMTLDELIDCEKMYIVQDDAPTTELVMMTVPLPDNKQDLKKFVKNSERWVAKRMKKGAEVQWKDIPLERLDDFQKAKAKELSNWIQESAVRLVKNDIPKDRIMKMRWIYTVKEDNSAKARIVIIGYQDPDLTSLSTTSPTMSRRTRGLFLTACACRRWQALKGDVKGAFLQGLESETERKVYAKPVIELAERLGGDKYSYVQICKACYGLANAPAQWHASVSATMREAGFIQLQSEPCAWRLTEVDENGEVRLIGLAVAHVDDFLFGGEASNERWQAAIDYVYRAYRWSPWECDTYSHCGVQVIQKQDGTTVLNHAEYCESIEQIAVESTDEKRSPTEGEKSQLRGALGALQWRVFQSAPQHASRLSALQSQLSSPTIQTLKDTNKLVREVHAGRHVGLKYHSLEVPALKDVVFVAWSDAAVGNRRDLSSSGGYVIAACDAKILNGQSSQLNLISWKSGKLPRVARSSLSAEIQAFSITEEELMFVRLQWLEMIGCDIPLRDPASIVKQSPGVLVTDARSLFNVIQKGPASTSGFGLKEKYSALDMMSVFQRLAKCGTMTKWVHSDAQLADGLTKAVSNPALMRVLMDGVWTLIDDPTFTSAKRLKRDKKEITPKVFGVCECEPLFVEEPVLYLSPFLSLSQFEGHDTSFEHWGSRDPFCQS